MPTESEEAMVLLKEEIAECIRVNPTQAERDAAWELPPPSGQHVNSTDSTRGQPLVQRVLQRRAELVNALCDVPETALRARLDVETALASVDEQLTGDPEHLTDATAAALNRWLEANKHLAEKPTDEPNVP